jgi:hypothetical protein
MFLSGSVPSLPRVRSRNETSKCIGQRILGAIDLAIDIATLGEYGLEPLPAQGPVHAGGHADGPCRERPGRQTGWEAFAKARRGDCGARGSAVRFAAVDHRD